MKSPALIEVFQNQNRVGKLALTRDGVCAFEYDPEFLASGFSISPFVLPLEKKVFIAERTPFFGNFGVFDDSLPDGWGSLLVERYLRERFGIVNPLNILQKLSLVGKTGRGSLEYFPDESFLSDVNFSDFDEIARHCAKLLEEKEISPEDLEAIYNAGGSSGGARPKVFARINKKEWLVKFRASADPKNVGSIEYAYSVLAKKCGIEMPDTQLIQGKYFAVERFDRSSAGKIHTITASGLANAYYRIPSLDYTDLLLITQTLIGEHSALEQMFRRMVFNVLIGNKDDHSKNFAFQYVNGVWALAPAYDMLPSEGFNGQHTTAINGKGNPEKSDIVAVGERVGLSKKQASKIFEDIREILEQHPKPKSDNG